MPKISFVKGRAPADVRDGANLMRALLEAGLPVASSCDGDGICSKCRLQVVAGAENLTKATPLERRLAAKENLAPDERISCQTRVRGDVTVDATYW